jgi:hypothetical protein
MTYAQGGNVPVPPAGDSIAAVLSEGSVACVHCEWEKVGGTSAEQGVALREHMRSEHSRR